MKQALTYFAPIQAHKQTYMKVETLDKSKEIYDEGKHLESLHMFLDGLGVDRKKYGNPEGTRFSIPHGSIVLDIEIEGDTFKIGTDFLRIPQENRIPMIRQVLQMNLEDLMLARFICRGDILRIEYSCPISLINTYKLYPLVRNICNTADEYDDIFCQEFGAERVYTPIITRYPDAELRRVYDAIQQIGREGIERVRELTDDRRHLMAWFMISATFIQIYHVAQPKGCLDADINKALVALDEQLPDSELVPRAVKTLEEILSRSYESIVADIYEAEMIISAKRRSSLKLLQNMTSNAYEAAAQAGQSGDYDAVYARLIHILYNAMRIMDMQDDLATVIESALKASSGKPIEEAALILYRAVDSIHEGEPEVTEVEPQGFFARLLRRIVKLFAQD